MHAHPFRHGALVGGKGCVQESTRVLTARGPRAIGDLRGSQEYVSLGPNGFRLSQGAEPFPKGKANLFRVVHEHGEFVAAGHHLVLDSRGEYVSVQSLQVGQGLLDAGDAFAKDLPPTNRGLGQRSWPLDVRRWKETLEDFLERCGVCIRRYGRSLPLGLEAFQVLSPSLAYAQTFDLGFCRERPLLGDGCTEPQQAHNHSGRWYDQSSRRYFPLHTSALFDPWACRILSRVSEPASLESQGWRQSRATSSARPIEREPFEQFHSWQSPLPPTKIQSIERLARWEWYWDLQVPGDNNYIAEGIVHHNSGKTRGAIEDLIVSAFEFPGTGWLIGRKTLPSLKDSTWREFKESLNPALIKDDNKSERVVTLINDSYILGRPLDEMKKFESIKLAGFMLDEADEIDKPIYDTLKSRVRQIIHVNGQKVQPRYRTFLVLNPCEEDHWIPQLFLHNKPHDHEIFFSSSMDNLENLPDDYVDQLKSIYTEDMQMRMIHGQFGKVHRGRPVFPQFGRGHFIQPIDPDPTLPIFRCFDFGYNRPACVHLQYKGGQLRVLGSILGKEQYLDDFLKDTVFPKEKQWFDIPRVIPQGWRGWRFEAFCDPAGSQETDKGKTSVEILNEFGIYPTYRRTRIEEGIKAIKHFMDTKTFDGDQGLVVHPRCTNLIEGLRGGYHRLDGEDDPHKDGRYDHEIDAFRYGAIHLFRRWKFGNATQVFSGARVIVNPRTGRRIEI